jgi:hypothetical protein
VHLRRWLNRTLLVVGAVLATHASAAKTLTEDDVSAAVTKIIADRSKDGVFSLRDAKTGAVLALEYDQIRVVRGLTGYGWFPEAIFREKGTPQKKYALDFWLKPDGDQLKLLDVRVHKDPQPDGASFMMITRAPLLWWWLPTLERKSAVSGVEAWQVMGAAHEYVVTRLQQGAFPFVDADGKTIPLELIQIDQPVGRSKANGVYIACAEFRNLGDPTAYKDIDFGVERNAGSLQVASVRPHPTATTSNTSNSPQHCRFEGDAFEAVD